MKNQQKADLQNLSFNELQELGAMMGEITQTINAYYSHVKKYIPLEVSLSLIEFFQDINKETEKRIF